MAITFIRNKNYIEHESRCYGIPISDIFETFCLRHTFMAIEKTKGIFDNAFT